MYNAFRKVWKNITNWFVPRQIEDWQDDVSGRSTPKKAISTDIPDVGVA
jgi:hypothetical protein